jgi:hypothetical protein
MLQSKILSKFEYYWLNDFQFRKLIQSWDNLNSSSQILFSDLQCEEKAYYEFYISVTNTNYNPPHPSRYDFSLRNHFYELGWKLGLEGKIASILKQEDWIQFTTRKEAENIREKLKVDPNFALGYFFEGLEGNLYKKFSSFLPKDHILANLAGYDFFLRRNEK